MTLSTTKKRLDNIEVYLTPKEWAIRIAREIRKYPSQDEFNRAELKGSYKASLFFRPYDAFEKQIGKQHPGNKQREVETKRALTRQLHSEFHVLKTIILHVNIFLMERAETIRLRAALRLSELQASALQDAFACTGARATRWVKRCNSDAGDKEERQTVLKELERYRYVSPVTIADIAQDLASLVVDVVSRRAAVRIIQDRYLDGEAFLFRDLEDELQETIEIIEDGVTSFNGYLKTRAALLKVYRMADKEPLPMLDLEGIKKAAENQIAAGRADHWITRAKQEAEASTIKATRGDDEYIAFERQRLAAIFEADGD